MTNFCYLLIYDAKNNLSKFLNLVFAHFKGTTSRTTCDNYFIIILKIFSGFIHYKNSKN